MSRLRLAVSVAATAAALIAAGGLTPALAASGPSMTVNNGSVNMAIQGPRESLRFYWAVNGTATWHPETVAGPFSTYSAPSMTVNGNSVNIAAEGPDHSLVFYWAVNGQSSWHAETVAGPGSAYSAPSMTVNGNSVNIAVQGPGHSLNFYWAVNGTATWHRETVDGSGSTLPRRGSGRDARTPRRAGWSATRRDCSRCRRTTPPARPGRPP